MFARSFEARCLNTDGNRFVNEGAARDVLAKAIFAQKDSTYYVLVNHLRYPSLTWVDRNGAKVGDMIDLGRVVAADTLEELAAKLKMPVENLKGSIDTYNAVVRGEKKDPLGFVVMSNMCDLMPESPILHFCIKCGIQADGVKWFSVIVECLGYEPPY